MGASEFDIDIWIDAPPALVFEYFTDTDRFLEWQGPSAEFELRPGGLYRVEYGDAAVIVGEFVEIDPPRRLVYARRLEGRDAPPSRVEIDLVPERNGTRVCVHQTGFAADEGVERGWPHFLGQLEQRLAA